MVAPVGERVQKSRVSVMERAAKLPVRARISETGVTFKHAVLLTNASFRGIVDNV